MINWVKPPIFIEPGLRVSGLGIGHTEFPHHSAEGQRGSPAFGEMRDKSDRPGRGEQSTLPRIHSIHGLPNITRVSHGSLPVRIHPQPNGTWANVIRFHVDKG